MPVIRRRPPVAADGDTTRPVNCRNAGERRARTAWRRVGRGVLLVAAGTAALALAGPFALRPFVDVAGAAGDVTVAFVLDFGGHHSNQVVGCVTVPASDNGYDALAAFASQEHLALPTYAPSGLLCSINGVPSTGCGQADSGGYIYWSYFTADNGPWQYASSGAFGAVTQGDIQGWRFQDPGKGNPDDPPPRTDPVFADICPAEATTTTTTTTAPRVRPARSPHLAKSHASTTTSTTDLSLAAPNSASGSSGSTTTTTTDPGDTPTTLPETVIPPDPEAGVVSANHSSGKTGGPGPDPLIAGGLLVAVLAIAAYTRWRKRPRTP